MDPDSSLTLEDITFLNFKEEYNSLISLTNGTLTLTNVVFQNVTVNQSVIVQTGTGAANVSVIGGIVEQLNNGYEYQSGVIYAGFLISSSAHMIVLDSLTFQYNLLGVAGNLIAVSNFVKFQVSNCYFYYNLGVVISVSSTEILPLDLNANNTLLSYALTHISLTNSTFTGNSGNTLVSVTLSGDILNMRMQNCSFTSCLSTVSGLVSFVNTGSPKEYAINGAYLSALTSGSRIKVLFPKTRLEVSQVVFRKCSVYGDALLSVKSLANILLQDIRISGSGDIGSTQQIYTMTLQPMMEYPGMYLSQPVANLLVLNCRSLIYLQSVYNTNIIQSEFSTNICLEGSAGLVGMNLYQETLISALQFTSNTAMTNTLGAILDLPLTGPGTISGLICTGNTNLASSGSSIIKLTSSSTNPIVLTDSSFTANYSPTGSTLSCNGSFNIFNTRFTSNTSSGSTAAGILYTPLSTAAVLSLTTVTFSKNVSSFGGALMITEALEVPVAIQVTIFDTVFDYNVSGQSGSCIYISSLVRLTPTSSISYTSFINNFAPAACIFNSFLSGILLIDECVFRNNTGLSYSVLATTHAASTPQFASRIVLQNTLIELNKSYYIIWFSNSDHQFTEGVSKNLTFQSNIGRGIYMQFAYWTESGSVFRNNTSTTSGAGFFIISSCVAQMTNTSFVGNSAVNSAAGAVYINGGSFAGFSNCIFQENHADLDGGAIMLDQYSITTINSCIFVRNKAVLEGAAISYYIASLQVPESIINTVFAENESAGGVISAVCSNVSMVGCSVYRNKAPDNPGLLIYLSQFRITDSFFSDQIAVNGAFVAVLAPSNVYVLRTSFTNGEVSDRGVAIYAIASNLTISQSVFSNLTASAGSAVTIYASLAFRISDCQFDDLVSTQLTGGAVSISESSGSIVNSVFRAFINGAIVGDTSNVVIAGSSFAGLQANFAACFLLQVTESQVFYTLRNCSFQSNTGQTMGALVLSNVNALISDSTFTNNSAILNSGDGGGIYFSCTQALGCQVNISNSIFANNTASHNGGGIAWTYSQPTLTNVSFFNNKASYGSNVASYAVKLAPLGPIHLYELSGVPSGQVATESIVVALLDHYDQVVATDNTSLAYVFSPYSNTSVSGTTRVAAIQGVFAFTSYTITYVPGSTTAIKLQTNGIDTSKPALNISLSPILVIAVNMRECTIGESLMANICYVCPEGKYSLDPVKACQDCPSGAICLGNFTMVPMSGYWRSSNISSTFWTCPNSAACLGSSRVSSNLSFTGLCATGYFSNLCNGCLNGFSRTSTSGCSLCPNAATIIAQVTVIGIVAIAVVLYIIKTSIVSAHRSQSQSSIYLKIFLNYLHLLAVASTFQLSWPSMVQELLHGQGSAGNFSENVFAIDCFFDTGSSDNQQQVVFLKVAIVACIPLFIVAASLSFWLTVVLCYRSWHYLKFHFINSLVVLFFMAHPSIVKLMFDVFNCKEIDPGEFWMDSYLNIRCWDTEHMRYAMIVALPSIILWGFFTPAFALFVLIFHRKLLDSQTTRIRFGFLYNGYKSEVFFWEFIILYRKLIFIVFAVFLTNVSIPVQALCAMLVLIFAFLLQIRQNPYYTSTLNDMETRAILVAAITIYCGLFFMTRNLETVSQLVLFALIISANVYFLMYWLLHVCRIGQILLEKCVLKLRNLLHPERLGVNFAGDLIRFRRDEQIPRPESSSVGQVMEMQIYESREEESEDLQRLPRDLTVAKLHNTPVESFELDKLEMDISLNQ